MEMSLVVLGLAQGGRQRHYGPRCHGDYFLADERQGLVVKYVCSGCGFSQNAEIGQEDFLNCLVTGMEIEYQGHFSGSLDSVFAVTFAKSSLPAYSLGSLPT